MGVVRGEYQDEHSVDIAKLVSVLGQPFAAATRNTLKNRRKILPRYLNTTQLPTIRVFIF